MKRYCFPNRLIYLVLIPFFLNVTAQTRIEDYKDIQYRTLTSKEGLSQMTVLDIIQDSHGYMWFATREGINRFDGNQIVVFKNKQGDPTSISSNYTASFALDKNHKLWIGTHYGLNEYDPKKENFKNYFYKSEESNSDYNRIRKIIHSPDGKLWLGTKGGLLSFSIEDKEFTLYPAVNFPIYTICLFEEEILIAREPGGFFSFNPHNGDLKEIKFGRDIEGTSIRAIYYSKNKEIFVGTERVGMLKLDNDFRVREHYQNKANSSTSLSNNSIRYIVEDKNGNVFAATFDGISILSPSDNRFVTINNQEGKKERFSHFSFHSVYIDTIGTLWGGTWAGGVNYGNPVWESNSFKVLNPYPQKRHMGIIGPLVADKDGIWIGIEGSGLVYCNTDTKSFKHIDLPVVGENNVRTHIITALARNASMLYAATNNGLIFCIDRQTQHVVKKLSMPDNKSVVCLRPLHDGTLLAGTNGRRGLVCFTKDGKTIDTFYDNQHNPLVFEFVRGIENINDNEIIIVARDYGYYRYNLETLKCEFIDFSQYTHSQSDLINCIYKDQNSQLWFGTSENGLYWVDLQGKLLNHYAYPEKLTGNTINSITSDDKGNIWISQLNNLSTIDVKTQKIKNYTSFDINEFSTRSALTSEGMIYFGGDKGLVMFEPLKINEKKSVPPLVINRLTVNNIPVKPSELDFRNTNFKLRYNQSNITIDYTALEYFSPKEIQYAYMLEGFDKDWSYVQNGLRAYYTNLPPGHYKFRLKASRENDETWLEAHEMSSLQFIVTPPFWKTWWAYLLYFLLCVIAAYLVFYYMKVQLRLKNDIILQKEKQMNMEKLHEDRMMLFTNLSHELRTPLSLIIGPLENLLSDTMLSIRIRPSLELVLKNAKRLLFISNELLDFRKKESSTLEIKVAVGNISLFVYEISLSFSQLAEQHSIQLVYEGKDDGIHIWYDRFWMEKVLFNLLSNSFKNTPDGGCIEIHSFIQDAAYNLVIKDTGQGIPEDQLTAIFEPFHQVHRSNDNSNGTGIGLSLVKGIIELHNGSVLASNREEGGACFHICMPLGKAHFSEEQIIEDYKSSEEISQYPFIEETDEDSILPDPDNLRKTILVIEDNKDLRFYLQNILKKYYQVITANNGMDGLAIALDRIPDLVLSDIMMPKMNGIELCKQLKSGEKTSHIPIVLLTARSSISNIQEGLYIGADDYFTKPFNPSILISKIDNILSSRERLEKYYGKTFGEEFIKTATTNTDKEFLNRLYYIIESNISNPDFTTDILGRKIGMSKTGLYNKVKELTGYAPSELIKKIRMDLAVKILQEGKMPISDIAIQLGFRSNSYFSSSFKAIYNMSPSMYIKQNSSD